MPETQAQAQKSKVKGVLTSPNYHPNHKQNAYIQWIACNMYFSHYTQIYTAICLNSYYNNPSIDLDLIPDPWKPGNLSRMHRSVLFCCCIRAGYCLPFPGAVSLILQLSYENICISLIMNSCSSFVPSTDRVLTQFLLSVKNNLSPSRKKTSLPKKGHIFRCIFISYALTKYSFNFIFFQHFIVEVNPINWHQ